MNDREYLVEVGVPYLHLKDGETPPRFTYVGVYVQHHLPTDKTSRQRIAVQGNRDSLLRLLDHWNGRLPDTWHYRLYQG